MTRRVMFDSRPADDMVASGSLAGGSVMGESPVGFILPSSHEVVRLRSKAEADTSVNPWMGSDSGSEGPSS